MHIGNRKLTCAIMAPKTVMKIPSNEPPFAKMRPNDANRKVIRTAYHMFQVNGISGKNQLAKSLQIKKRTK